MGVCPVGQGPTLEDGNKGMDQRNKNLGFRRDMTNNHQACHTFWLLAVREKLLFPSHGSGILV